MKLTKITLGALVVLSGYLGYQIAFPTESLCRTIVVDKNNHEPDGLSRTIAEVKDSGFMFRFKIHDREFQSVVLTSFNFLGDSIIQEDENRYIRSIRNTTDKYIEFYQYDTRYNKEYIMQCPKK